MNGFFFSNPWGLLALASVAAVVAAYLFYQRYRPRRVTGLFLWGVPPRSLRGGRHVEPPRLSRSFWLDLLAALLLALAVASPAWLWKAGRLPVILLDDSFSMQSRGNDREALAQARTLLAAGGVGGVVVLVGEQPRLLVQPDTPPQTVAELLAGYQPFSGGADFKAALKLADTLFDRQLDIHIITDHSLNLTSREGDTLTLHQLAGRGGNLAFSGLWREVQKGGEYVYARVCNNAERPVQVEYVLTALPDDKETSTGSAATGTEQEPAAAFRKVLTLEPGQTVECETAVSSAPGVLRAELRVLSGDDVIPADSVAFLPPPPGDTVTYALDGIDAEAARYFRLGLDAAGAVELDTGVVAPASSATIKPAAPGVPGAPGAATATRGAGGVAPAVVPPVVLPSLLVTGDQKNAGRTLTLELLPPVYPVTFSPPYVIDLAATVCRDVHLGPGYWTAASDRPQLPENGWLIAADRHPLFWRSGAGRYVLNLVPAKSSIVASNAWPALLANLVNEARLSLPGLRRTCYAPGRGLEFIPVSIASAAGSTSGTLPVLQLFSGNQLVNQSPAGGFLRLPQKCGMYDLRQAGTLAGRLSVLPLYGTESDTRQLADLAAESRLGDAQSGWREATLLFFWLPLVVGLLLLLLNWRLGGDDASREVLK